MTNGQSEFWSKVARQYDAVVDLQIGPNTRSMVRERLAREGKLGRLAEFGCGTGFYTELLALKADEVVATDLAPGMLAVARQRITASNVRFQVEDCQKTSLPEAAFDTAFMSLLIHFTKPELALAEMRRILRPGGLLIISNLDLEALRGLDRVRCLMRVLFHGLTRYRTKPPKGFSDHIMTERQLCQLLERSGFKVLSTETFKDLSRSSNVPVEYIKAAKV